MERGRRGGGRKHQIDSVDFCSNSSLTVVIISADIWILGSSVELVEVKGQSHSVLMTQNVML